MHAQNYEHKRNYAAFVYYPRKSQVYSTNSFSLIKLWGLLYLVVLYSKYFQHHHRKIEKVFF